MAKIHVGVGNQPYFLSKIFSRCLAECSISPKHSISTNGANSLPSHQPQTARCLVFFLLLGKMCEVITVCYEKAIDTLSSILKLDVSQNQSNKQCHTDID